MSRLEVPAYKPWEIEPIAQKFLSTHWDPSETWVDIEMIIEGPLGLLIDYSRLDSFRTIGAICRRPSDARLVIVVGEELADRNPNRYRFTLAQEVSHLLLHRELLASLTTGEEAMDFHQSLSEAQYGQMERDVNRCAGAVLMPQHELNHAAYDSYARWFASIRSEVGTVLPTFLQRRVIDDLAKRYRVSFQAAEIRLRQWPIELYDDLLESARKSQPQLSSGWT